MEAGHPPADSQVARVPSQRTPSEPAAPTPVAVPPRPRRRRWGIIIGVLAGVLALLLVGGATTAYVLYDRYTRPDRSTPIVVVDSFLRSFLVYRDDVQAGQYTCTEPAGLAPLRAARGDMEARERELSANFDVSWGALQAAEHGESADVTVEIVITNWVDTMAYSAHQSWRFGTQLVDDEWWVCQATRLD